MEPEIWVRAAIYAGYTPTTEQTERLRVYRDWLVREAIPAGGLSAAESTRLDDRHLGDSLVLARFAPSSVTEAWDLGTGVGLPGIPLAILLPGMRWLLVDRSGRRIDLTQRAVRILELDNVETRHSPIETLQGRVEFVVSRAAIPPSRAWRLFGGFLQPGGVAVMGGSWRQRPIVEDWFVEEIPATVLDQPVWVLIMRRE